MSTEERPGVDDPKDQEIDSLLRQSFQRESARSTDEPTPDCVEAETLAAWSDGALPREEARAVEAHAAGCARCQAMLAAFARSEPVVESLAQPATAADGAASDVSVWQRWRLGWLVPMAATAAALAIWVATPSRPVGDAPNEVAVQSKPAPIESAGEAKEEQFRPGAELARDALSAPLAAVAPPPVTPPASPSAMARRREPRGDGARLRQATPDSSAATGASANAAPSIAPPSSAEVTAERARRQEAPSERRVDGSGALADKRSPASPVPPSPLAAAARAIGSSATRTDLEIAGVGTQRWRVRQDATATVEFSGSSGREWVDATVPAGAPGTLVAGVAAGDRVCWLVGAGGMVLLTADGVSFRRLAFPEAVDLTFVSAEDARHATVRAADRRIFTTADGGATWVAAQP